MGVCSLQARPSIKAFEQGTPEHEATGSLHPKFEGDEEDRQQADVQLGPGLDLLLDLVNTKTDKSTMGQASGYPGSLALFQTQMYQWQDARVPGLAWGY